LVATVDFDTVVVCQFVASAHLQTLVPARDLVAWVGDKKWHQLSLRR
jgi:hypothetical protein